MQFFVSSPNVDQPPASRLIEALRTAGHNVEHSPRGSRDPRWAGWYAAGCRQAVERADTFIIVLDRVWDSSTWMCCEAETGLARTGGDPRRFVFWNPLGLRVTAAGAVPYLRSELPADLMQAVASLTRDSNDTRAIGNRPHLTHELRRSLLVGTLIVEGLWSVCLAAGSTFAYLNTTVPGTDGASILPLTAWAVVLGALAIVSLAKCWLTARRGVQSGPLWWISAMLGGKILVLVAFAVPAGVAAYWYFSGALLAGDYPLAVMTVRNY